MISFDFCIKMVKYSWIWVCQSLCSLTLKRKPYIISRDGWIKDPKCYRSDDLRDYYFNFLFASTSDTWLKWVQQSSNSSWKRLSYLYGYLQTILGFDENKYTVSNQLQSTLANILTWKLLGNKTLRKKCPNTEFFPVRIFLYSDWLNTGKYGPEKTPYMDTFHRVRNV